MPILQITVVNRHHAQEGEFIGYDSPLHNPWHINPKETREDSLIRYSRYLHLKLQEGDEAVTKELERLAGLAMQGPLNLQCYCAPRACHGDVIKDLLITAITSNNPEYTVES